MAPTWSLFERQTWPETRLSQTLLSTLIIQAKLTLPHSGFNGLRPVHTLPVTASPGAGAWTIKRCRSSRNFLMALAERMLLPEQSDVMDNFEFKLCRWCQEPISLL